MIWNLGPGLALSLQSLDVLQGQADLDDHRLSLVPGREAKLTQVELAFIQVYQKSQQKLI